MRTYALLVALIPVCAAAQTAPRFERADCNYPAPNSIGRDMVRECGFLIVPENRARPNGRTYRLAVVTYKAKEPDGSPPLLLLHGGPGGIGGVRFPWGGIMQFPLVGRRDVVIFDNRGVGLSEPAPCPHFAEDAQPAFYLRARTEWEAAYRVALRKCSAALDSARIDRSAFGGEVNALDAADLRRALGITKWDIYGVSYGGVVAQELMRTDPQGIRAAALISTLPPGTEHWADHTLASQQNLDRMFASCAAQAECNRAFPTLAADFQALYDDFSARPAEVPIPNVTPARTVVLNGDRFILELRRELVQPTQRSRVPLLINELRRGNREQAIRRLIGDGRVSPWDAIGRLVQCNEYGAGYRAAVAATLPRLRPMFHAGADDFREHCDIIVPKPTRQLDPRPVVSDIPTLVIHGENEATQVPAAQKRLTAGLKTAYVYTLPGEGHAPPPVDCHGIIVQSFIENPNRAPDASCISGMRATTFVTRRFETTLTVNIDGSSAFAGTWDNVLFAGRDWTMHLRVDGESVTGQVVDYTLPIFDGRRTGNTMTFKVRSFDNARTITFSAQLQGDTIAFTRSVEVVPGGNAGQGGLFGVNGPRMILVRRVR